MLPRPKENELGHRLAQAGLLPPRKLTLALTDACNLRCRHCYVAAAEGSDRGEERVAVEDVKRVVEEFVRMGGEELCLTGGEPLAHPDWLELLVFCCRLPQLRSVRLQTNAALVSPVVARALQCLDGSRLHFQVSLDGGNAPDHDRVRGQGSFEASLGGLQRLVGAGFGARCTIAFTEMRHNMAGVPALLERAERIGVSSVVGAALVRHGRAVDQTDLAPPTADQYRELLSLYHNDETFRARYDRCGTFSAIEWFKGRDRSSKHGCRFIDHPYVATDGSVYPCPLLQVGKFAGKGAYEHCLTAALAETVDKWGILQQKSRCRHNAPTCSACPGKAHCGGGCLARAYLPSGRFDAPEDRCELRRSVYSSAS